MVGQRVEECSRKMKLYVQKLVAMCYAGIISNLGPGPRQGWEWNMN